MLFLRRECQRTCSRVSLCKKNVSTGAIAVFVVDLFAYRTGLSSLLSLMLEAVIDNTKMESTFAMRWYRTRSTIHNADECKWREGRYWALRSHSLSEDYFTRGSNIPWKEGEVREWVGKVNVTFLLLGGRVGRSIDCKTIWKDLSSSWFHRAGVAVLRSRMDPIPVAHSSLQRKFEVQLDIDTTTISNHGCDNDDDNESNNGSKSERQPDQWLQRGFCALP